MAASSARASIISSEVGTIESMGGCTSSPTLEACVHGFKRSSGERPLAASSTPPESTPPAQVLECLGRNKGVGSAEGLALSNFPASHVVYHLPRSYQLSPYWVTVSSLEFDLSTGLPHCMLQFLVSVSLRGASLKVLPSEGISIMTPIMAQRQVCGMLIARGLNRCAFVDL